MQTLPTVTLTGRQVGIRSIHPALQLGKPYQLESQNPDPVPTVHYTDQPLGRQFNHELLHRATRGHGRVAAGADHARVGCCCHWEGHSPFPLSARQLGPIKTTRFCTLCGMAGQGLSRFDILRHMARPRYFLGLLGFSRPLLVLEATTQPILLPVCDIPSSDVAIDDFLHAWSCSVIPHHREGSHDPIGFDSIQPNRTCVSNTPAGQPPCRTLKNGRAARIESASESVSSGTLGRRTSPPIPRPGGTIDPDKRSLLPRLNSHAHTLSDCFVLWVTAWLGLFLRTQVVSMMTIPIWWHAPSESRAWIVHDVTFFRQATHADTPALFWCVGTKAILPSPGAAISRPEACQLCVSRTVLSQTGSDTFKTMAMCTTTLTVCPRVTRHVPHIVQKFQQDVPVVSVSLRAPSLTLHFCLYPVLC